MKVLIVEDELNAFEYLRRVLLQVEPRAEVLANTDSVSATLDYLHTDGGQLDLIFMDIQLSDGLSFEIFQHREVVTPIIFTTAYDEYAIEAFKVHSVDYLLKPILQEDLKKSIDKYHRLYTTDGKSQVSSPNINQVIQSFARQKKNRCLVKKGGHFEYIDVSDIAYVHSEDSITFLHTQDGSRHIYSKSIEALYEELDDKNFFQISRSHIVHVNSIDKIHPYFNQRLKLSLKQVSASEEIVVSRHRVSDFKAWLDQ